MYPSNRKAKITNCTVFSLYFIIKKTPIITFSLFFPPIKKAKASRPNTVSPVSVTDSEYYFLFLGHPDLLKRKQCASVPYSWQPVDISDKAVAK